MKRVLVTGAQGFIGKHLCERLHRDGYTVFGVDDLSSGQDPEDVKFVGLTKLLNEWSIRDDFASKWILSQVKGYAFDVIVHLAATPRVAYSVEYPLETFENNVAKTARLVEAARNTVEKFVFASSSSVYGDSHALPTHENNAPAPKSPYAMQKAVVEQILAQYSMHYGMKNTVLRLFNVFGPGNVANSPYATAVSAWLTAYHTGRPCRFDGSGVQSRDLCYVDNTVDGIVRAIEYEDKVVHYDVFNIACGQRTTNNDVFDFLKKRYLDIEMVEAPYRPGDVKHTQADITRAEERLGYKPLVYVMDGLERTCEWFEETFTRP
jgi:UDP-N-acetylglucosamine 4-epimerase